MPEPHSETKLYVGFVDDDKDPQKQGRVKVRIPGLLEPAAWAEVLMIGSSYNRGDYTVPVIGGQVLVGFLQGELSYPVVLGGIAPPVLAGGIRGELTKDELPSFRFMENEDWIFVMGKKGTIAPYVAIYSRQSTNRLRIVMDLDSHSIKVEAPMSIQLETKGVLELNGQIVKINDRVVSRNQQPI
jgi:hypothetical protein